MWYPDNGGFMPGLLKLVLLGMLFFAGIILGFLFILGFFSSDSAVYAPNVSGFPVEQARFIAEREHLSLVVKEEAYDTRKEKGIIIKQMPVAGMSARKGHTIYVTVSKGIERVTVPDFTALTLDKAQIALGQSGMELKGVSYIFSDKPSQTVISQSPDAGAVVSMESGAFLLVSQGGQRPLFLMPGLKGGKIDEYPAAFSEYGISVNIENQSKGEGKTIKSQIPLPGYPVTSEDTVRLGVGE